MEQFDGIDIDEGTKGLNKFKEDADEIIDCYLNAFNKFNVDLSELWASPNAVKYNADLDKMLDFPRKFAVTINSLISATTYIHSLWAKSQGDEYKDDIARVAEDGYDYIRLVDSISSPEYGRLEGINDVEAKKSCEEFVKSCKDFVVPKIENLKINTGIHDKGDMINKTQEKKVGELAKKISDELDIVQSTFDKKIKNEIVELRLSVKSAESTLEAGPMQTPINMPETKTTDNNSNTATPKPSSVIKPNNPAFDRVSFF